MGKKDTCIINHSHLNFTAMTFTFSVETPTLHNTETPDFIETVYKFNIPESDIDQDQSGAFYIDTQVRPTGGFYLVGNNWRENPKPISGVWRSTGLLYSDFWKLKDLNGVTFGELLNIAINNQCPNGFNAHK